MKVDLRSLVGSLGELARVAVRTYVTTLLLFVAAGILLAVGSYHFLRDHAELYGGAAGALALAEALAVGVFLAGRRAVAAVAAHALGSFRLGGSLVQSVFDRIPGLDDAEGERSLVARGLERLPLAQAEALLSAAVTRAIGDSATGGWLRRLIQARLLGLVQRYTLRRFREEGAVHGGIDVRQLRDELVRTVDDTLAQRVRGGARWWTGAALVGLTIVAAAQTGLLLVLLQRHG